MKKYKYLLFDMDGTLIDSKNGIIDSVLYSLKEMGINEADRKSLDFFVGPPLKDSFMKKYGMSEETALRGVKVYREHYPKTGVLNVELYPNVAETLIKLKNLGYKLYVATSKPTAFTETIVERTGIKNLFEGVVGSNLNNTRDRKCEVIDYVLKTYGITEKSETLMIGDKSFDIIGARICGIDAVGVLYGYGSKEELSNEKPIALIDKIEDLIDFLAENKQ